jgi:hypothetical protein
VADVHWASGPSILHNAAGRGLVLCESIPVVQGHGRAFKLSSMECLRKSQVSASSSILDSCSLSE